MDDIYRRIKIIPTKRCLVHEGIVQKWVDNIASNIKSDGLMRNPIIVAQYRGHYIVLDGMHRFAAFRQLEIRDILACEVDYFSDQIVLEGWDAFLFHRIPGLSFLKEHFSEGTGFRFVRAKNLREAKKAVLKRKVLLAVGEKNGAIWLLEKRGLSRQKGLDVLCEAVDKIDRVLSRRYSKLIYVDNSLSTENFSKSGALTIVLRPQFSKKEVLDRTLGKKIFPPKSTRHMIPERPLLVDVDLSLLRADISLTTKNKFLRDHLQWCYENNRVRFYPESVYVFAD